MNFFKQLGKLSPSRWDTTPGRISSFKPGFAKAWAEAYPGNYGANAFAANPAGPGVKTDPDVSLGLQGTGLGEMYFNPTEHPHLLQGSTYMDRLGGTRYGLYGMRQPPLLYELHNQAARSVMTPLWLPTGPRNQVDGFYNMYLQADETPAYADRGIFDLSWSPSGLQSLGTDGRGFSPQLGEIFDIGGSPFYLLDEPAATTPGSSTLRRFASDWQKAQVAPVLPGHRANLSGMAMGLPPF